MCIFQQAALGDLEDGRYYEEKRPGPHLGFGKGAYQHDEVDKTKKRGRKALKYRIKGGTDPIR